MRLLRSLGANTYVPIRHRGNLNQIINIEDPLSFGGVNNQ